MTIKITVPGWLAKKKGVNTVVIGTVIGESQLAWKVHDQSGKIEWYPKSQCKIEEIKGNITTEEKWVIQEVRGFDGKVLSTMTFSSEEEALNRWKELRDGLKFAGLGGQWKQAYTYPRKSKMYTESKSDEPTQLVGPGVYELPNGEIYVVKLNRERSHVYAKRLIDTPSDRVTEQGKVVSFDFEYESGAIFRIQPEHKMSLDRAKTLMIRYGRCIVCGRPLKVSESVERGIGPVCITYFGGGNKKSIPPHISDPNYHDDYGEESDECDEVQNAARRMFEE